MKLENIYNLDKMIYRSTEKTETTRILPLREILRVEPGYYTAMNSIMMNEGLEPNQRFTINGKEYGKKDEVEFTLTFPGAITAFRQQSVVGADKINKVTLNRWVLLSTLQIFNDILKDSQEGLMFLSRLQPSDMNVVKTTGNNELMSKIQLTYTLMYLIIYHYAAKDKCEYNEDLKIMERNIIELDRIYKDKIPALISDIEMYIDQRINTLLQPYIKRGQEQVGHSNMSSTMREIYKLHSQLKKKVRHSLSEQTESPTDLIDLREYLESILGQEENLYRLVELIREEGLDKDILETNKTSRDIAGNKKSVLIIDDDTLESNIILFVRRILKAKMEIDNKNLIETKKMNEQIYRNVMKQPKTPVTANNKEEYKRKIFEVAENKLAQQQQVAQSIVGTMIDSMAAVNELSKLGVNRWITLTHTKYQMRLDTQEVFTQEQANNLAIAVKTLMSMINVTPNEQLAQLRPLRFSKISGEELGTPELEEGMLKLTLGISPQLTLQMPIKKSEDGTVEMASEIRIIGEVLNEDKFKSDLSWNLNV